MGNENQSAEVVNVAAPKRGRGRPPGSKNREKSGSVPASRTILRVLNQVIKSVPESSDAELACYFLTQHVLGNGIAALLDSIENEKNESNAFLIELLREEFNVATVVEETTETTETTETIVLEPSAETTETTEETQAA